MIYSLIKLTDQAPDNTGAEFRVGGRAVPGWFLNQRKPASITFHKMHMLMIS